MSPLCVLPSVYLTYRTLPNLPGLPPPYLYTASNQIREVGAAWETRQCFTLDFTSSVRLAQRMMAVLFCWQVKQRSVIERATMLFGRCCHSLRNVEYVAVLGNSSLVASLYTSPTLRLVVLQGSSCTSLLYPGIHPGRRTAFTSA